MKDSVKKKFKASIAKLRAKIESVPAAEHGAYDEVYYSGLPAEDQVKDPFDSSMGFDLYDSPEMVNARKAVIKVHIKEHATEFIDSLQDLMVGDRDIWQYSLHLNFNGFHFVIHDEEELIEYLKAAEEVATTPLKSIKSKIYLKAKYKMDNGYPDWFWDSLHSNYDTICEELEKVWSTSFNMKGWETPYFSSVSEFNEFLINNNHPKL